MFTLTFSVSDLDEEALLATISGITPEEWLRAQLTTLVSVQVAAHRAKEAAELGLKHHPKDIGLTDEEAEALLAPRKAAVRAAADAKAAAALAAAEAKAAAAEAEAAKK